MHAAPKYSELVFFDMEVGGGLVGNDLSEGTDIVTRITIGAECLRMGQYPLLLEDQVGVNPVLPQGIASLAGLPPG